MVMIKKKILLPVILMFLFSPLAFAGVNCTTVYSNQNAEVDASFPTTNYGQAGYMTSANTPANSRSIMQFNLSDIGESRVVINCSLTIYVSSSGGGAEAYFNHLYNDTWDEDVITWNNHPTYRNGTSEAIIWNSAGGNWYTNTSGCTDMASMDYANASDRLLSVYSSSAGGTPVSFVTMGANTNTPRLEICHDDCIANFTLQSNTTYCYNATSIVQNEYYVDQNQCNSSYLSYSALTFTDCSGSTPDCVNATCVCSLTAYDNWIVSPSCTYECGIVPVGTRGVDQATCTYTFGFPILSLTLAVFIIIGLLVAVVNFYLIQPSLEPREFIKRSVAVILLVSIVVAMLTWIAGLL